MSEDKLQVDLSKNQNKLSKKNQVASFIWTIVWTIFTRPIPISLFNG